MKRLILLVLLLAAPAVAQRNDLGTARMIEALEAIINEDGTCCNIPAGSITSSLVFANAGSFSVSDAGSAISFTVRDVAAVDTSVDLVEINATTVQIGSGNTVRGLFIDLTTDTSTDGGEFVGVEIGAITTRASLEYGLRIGAGWDANLYFADTTATVRYATAGVLAFQDPGASAVFTLRDIPAAGTANDLMELDATLSAMDGSGDLFRGLVINLTNANHTAGVLYGAAVLSDTPDPQVTEGAYYADSDWDFHMVFEATDMSTVANPPASHIGFYVDDNTDWSGGGGNDCALVARDSGGATDVIATLVLNGACP